MTDEHRFAVIESRLDAMDEQINELRLLAAEWISVSPSRSTAEWVQDKIYEVRETVLGVREAISDKRIGVSMAVADARKAWKQAAEKD
jgi:hypothetical protein